MLFSDKVKRVRLELYLTQKQLGSMLGVSFSTVNRWEKGHHEPTFLVRGKFDELCKKKDIFFEEDKT
jgi:transcriptional regulator with XRE-family HTH domain